MGATRADTGLPDRPSRVPTGSRFRASLQVLRAARRQRRTPGDHYVAGPSAAECGAQPRPRGNPAPPARELSSGQRRSRLHPNILCGRVPSPRGRARRLSEWQRHGRLLQLVQRSASGFAATSSAKATSTPSAPSRPFPRPGSQAITPPAPNAAAPAGAAARPGPVRQGQKPAAHPRGVGDEVTVQHLAHHACATAHDSGLVEMRVPCRAPRSPRSGSTMRFGASTAPNGV